MRLVKPQSQSGCETKKKNPTYARNQTLITQPVSSHFTDWAVLTDACKTYGCLLTQAAKIHKSKNVRSIRK
jgi:hypothetical protein